MARPGGAACSSSATRLPSRSRSAWAAASSRWHVWPSSAIRACNLSYSRPQPRSAPMKSSIFPEPLVPEVQLDDRQPGVDERPRRCRQFALEVPVDLGHGLESLGFQPPRPGAARVLAVVRHQPLDPPERAVAGVQYVENPVDPVDFQYPRGEFRDQAITGDDRATRDERVGQQILEYEPGPTLESRVYGPALRGAAVGRPLVRDRDVMKAEAEVRAGVQVIDWLLELVRVGPVVIAVEEGDVLPRHSRYVSMKLACMPRFRPCRSTRTRSGCSASTAATISAVPSGEQSSATTTSYGKPASCRRALSSDWRMNRSWL